MSHPALAGLGALPAGSMPRGPSPLEDPVLVRGSSSLGKSASIPDVERPNSLLTVDRPLEDESNILFIDGLPTDCTRREVARILSMHYRICIIFLHLVSSILQALTSSGRFVPSICWLQGPQTSAQGAPTCMCFAFSQCIVFFLRL